MPFELAGKERTSRLILGTGGFPSLELLREAIDASGTELVTVALRHIDPAMRGSVGDGLERARGWLRPAAPATRGSLVDVLARAGVELRRNTAGSCTARDAPMTARLA